MNTIVIIMQGAIAGFVAGQAFGSDWRFWAAVIANSVLTVAYGLTKE